MKKFKGLFEKGREFKDVFWNGKDDGTLEDCPFVVKKKLPREIRSALNEMRGYCVSHNYGFIPSQIEPMDFSKCVAEYVSKKAMKDLPHTQFMHSLKDSIPDIIEVGGIIGYINGSKEVMEIIYHDPNANGGRVFDNPLLLNKEFAERGGIRGDSMDYLIGWNSNPFGNSLPLVFDLESMLAVQKSYPETTYVHAIYMPITKHLAWYGFKKNSKKI